jgi:hypothetical protein
MKMMMRKWSRTKMRAAITVLALVAVAMLVVAGCAQKTGAPLVPGAGEDKSSASQEATPEAASGLQASAQEQGITGDLTQADSLDSELSDPELDKTADYIDEIEW